MSLNPAGAMHDGTQLGEQRAQLGDVVDGGALGGERGRIRLDGDLGVEDLGDGDADELQLYRERVGEALGIALGDIDATLGADA